MCRTTGFRTSPSALLSSGVGVRAPEGARRTLCTRWCAFTSVVGRGSISCSARTNSETRHSEQDTCSAHTYLHHGGPRAVTIALPGAQPGARGRCPHSYPARHASWSFMDEGSLACLGPGRRPSSAIATRRPGGAWAWAASSPRHSTVRVSYPTVNPWEDGRIGGFSC